MAGDAHVVEYANRIDGREVPSEAGRFELRAAVAPYDVLGTWPLSERAEATRALDALRDRADDSLAPREMRDALCAAAASFDFTGRAARLVARRVGLRAEELAARDDGLVRDVERAVDSARTATRGIALVVPDWSGLLRGVFVDVCAELAVGRCVLLAPDPRLPMVGDSLVDALDAAGVPTGRVAVLHGLGEGGMATAVADPRTNAVRATGGRKRIATLRSRCDQAGIGDASLRLLRSASEVVRASDNPDAAARRVVIGAFGRVAALSGQAHGQIGRVYCDAHVFSEFTAALLARLSVDADANDPLPLIDPSAVGRVRREWEAGLDEGATLIAGGEALTVSDGAKARRLAASVFTNVEPHMALLRRQMPMPIVCLVRTSS